MSTLEQAEWLRQTMKDSPDIHIAVTGVMARLGVGGIGELARDFPADFDVIYAAAMLMVEEIPEDQLHQINAGKPAQ